MAEGRIPSGQFAPGNKLSPGRPKGRALWIRADLERLLNELTTIGPKDKEEVVTRKEAILRKAIEQAEEGDARAREWIADRTDGKVKETPPDEGGEDKKPIRIIDLDAEEVQAESD